jgi:hypothetical protein
MKSKTGKINNYEEIQMYVTYDEVNYSETMFEIFCRFLFQKRWIRPRIQMQSRIRIHNTHSSIFITLITEFLSERYHSKNKLKYQKL